MSRIPKKTKYRKMQKRASIPQRISSAGTQLDKGNYGLKAITSGRLTTYQYEAVRQAITRRVKKKNKSKISGVKVHLTVFPNVVVSKKPAEVRMGGGKGSPETWLYAVAAGRIIAEIAGDVDEVTAEEALMSAAKKLSFRTTVVFRRKTVLL